MLFRSWQYDLNNDEWKQVCDFDGGPLALFQGFVIGSDAYIIGGRDSLSNKLNTVWKFESNLMPQPFITSNNAGCAGDTTTLTVTGVASCVWNNGDTSHVISFVPTTPALYYVTSSNGACTLSDSIYIYVNTPPVTPVITGANDTLFSNSTGTYYQWYINGIPIIIGGNASYLAAPLPGTYTVYVSDANGCDAISLPFVFASINENADYENCIKSIIIHNQLQISWCENFTGSLTFELYSINGQLVYSNMINASQQNINIEVPIINKSFYLLRISNGNSTYNKKIVMVE